jgi:hypothetical protein
MGYNTLQEMREDAEKIARKHATMEPMARMVCMDRIRQENPFLAAWVSSATADLWDAKQANQPDPPRHAALPTKPKDPGLTLFTVT